jgi:hypothetical protein
MYRALAAAALLLVLSACEIPEPQLAVDRDTLTQRQKDSITATLPLPGAAGVGRALRAADAAQARADRHDALAGKD